MRIEYIDSLKGFGILLVIIGHICPGGIINSIIYSFHMAIFFLLSGIVCNNNNSIKDFVIKKTTTLLLPFITFSLLHSFIYRIPYSNIVKDNVKDGLWFLYVLFLIQMIDFIIYKITKSRILSFTIFNSVIIFILIVLKSLIPDNISAIFSLSFLATNYIFYVIGNFMNI